MKLFRTALVWGFLGSFAYAAGALAIVSENIGALKSGEETLGYWLTGIYMSPALLSNFLFGWLSEPILQLENYFDPGSALQNSVSVLNVIVIAFPVPFLLFALLGLAITRAWR